MNDEARMDAAEQRELIYERQGELAHVTLGPHSEGAKLRTLTHYHDALSHSAPQ